MKRIRFSIAGLMICVVVFALGFAGLKNANEYWASAYFTIVVALLVVSILNALFLLGKGRVYWAGFAIAGLAYFGLIFGLFGQGRVAPPPLLTESWFDRLEATWNPPKANTITFTFGGPAGMPAGLTATAGTPFLQIAHSLTVILFGMVGGLHASWLFGRRETNNSETRVEVSPSSP